METSRVRKLYEKIEETIREIKKPTFSDNVLRFCDMREAEEEGLTDADIYNEISMNRDLFCKIKNDRNYSTSKDTALALAIALHLDLDQTQELLESAGYYLSESIERDLIVRHFIEIKNYDCLWINTALEHFNQPKLFKMKTRKSRYDKK